MGCARKCVKKGLMWIVMSMERKQVAWVVALWPIKCLQKWYFSTHAAKIDLGEEEPYVVE